MSVTRSHCRSHRGLRKRLEPYAGKLARTVLRGGVASNSRSLPDYLAPDEAIFFKVYDSATDGRARYTLHTAFELPDPDPRAAPRHSVEMRLFAFY